MFKNAMEMLRHLDFAGWSERRDLEFKSGEAWDTLKQGLVKGALALSNIEGGGYIIVGIGKGEGDMVHRPEGMSREVAQTYDQDMVLDYINSFADPPITIKMQPLKHEGKFFVVIKIHEFARARHLQKERHRHQAGHSLLQEPQDAAELPRRVVGRDEGNNRPGG